MTFITKRCRHGTFTFNPNDTFVGRSLNLYGEWCESEITVLSAFAHEGAHVVDVGAYIGSHTVALAKLVGHGGMVYAIEPFPRAFGLLHINVAVNGLSDVVSLLHAAAGRAHKVGKLPRFPDSELETNFACIAVDGCGNDESITVIAINDLNLPACDLIKIDVEGLEPDVLAGATQTINRFRPVLFVENNNPDNGRPVNDAVLNLGYRAFWHIAPYFNPANFFQNPVDVWRGYRPEANLLCLPREMPNPYAGHPSELNDPDETWMMAAERLRRYYA